MLTMTEAAVDAIRKTLEAEKLPPGAWLRVKVKSGGCSGLSYDLSFEENPGTGDSIIERDGVHVLVDSQSAPYLEGTELDYTSGLTGKGFVFRNPNASGSCGCGMSFSV